MRHVLGAAFRVVGDKHSKTSKEDYIHQVYQEIVFHLWENYLPQKVPTANAQPLDPSLLLGCPQLSQINENLNYFSYKCGVRGIALPQAVPIRPGVLKTADV